MTMNNLDEIKAAIQKLSGSDRRTLQAWLATTSSGADDHDADILYDRVAEPAKVYRESAEHRWLSVDQYLEFEAQSERRHEYIDGVLYAMAGASEKHELIKGNLFAAIHGHLRGGPCKAYSSDFKVRLQIERRDLFYYPDVMVACGREGVASHYLHCPKLIVEVLSPSTESIDRREKFLSYKQIGTVEEYALIAQEAAQITIYRRATNWVPQMHTRPDEIAAFQSIGLSLPLAQIYEGVPSRSYVSDPSGFSPD
jgi:Uma2 family endonuclease